MVKDIHKQDLCERIASGGQLAVGRLLLIHEENHHRFQWYLGCLIKVHPDFENVMRAATVEASGGLIRRATKRLTLLPK